MNGTSNLISASLILVLQYILPVILIGSVIAIISIDHRLKKIEEHFEQLCRVITKYVYDNSSDEPKAVPQKQEDISAEMPSVSINSMPSVEYISNEPWECVYCKAKNIAGSKICRACGKSRYLI